MEADGKKNSVIKWARENPLMLIVLSALFFRLFTFTLYQHINIYPDSQSYLNLADMISAFSLSGYEGQRSPGYPLLILLAGKSKEIIVIIQSVLGILTLLVFYKSLLQLKFIQMRALLMTMLMAAFLPIIFFELSLLSETLTLFIITVLFYFLIDYNLSKTKKTLIIAILSTVLVLIKPFYIFLPILLMFYYLYISIRRDVIAWNNLFLLPSIAIVCFMAWSFVNKVNIAIYTPTSYYGYNLAQNCVSFAEHTTDEYKTIANIYASYRDKNIELGKNTSMSIWEAEEELMEETKLDFVGLSAVLYDYSKVTIALNPIAYLKQVFVSWRDFWKTSLYWQVDKIEDGANVSALTVVVYAERILFQLVKIVFVIFIPCNLYRLIRYREDSFVILISLIVFSASILQALSTYGTNSRFSFPFELLILTSVILNFRSFLKQKS